ncbi:hypothetical protein AAC387_Pa05g0177 [Persea americana]
MLRLRAFRPSNDKIVKIQLHPTHPWLVTADASDHVSVWNWEHRQVIYELKAGGVDERRLVGAKLEKLAEGESEPRGKPTEAMRGGSVKQVSFFDDDVRFWQLWHNRSAAAEAPSAVHQHPSAFSPPASSTRGRHFLVICCENKAIFLDLVTMRGRDVPKQDLDNKSLLCMEFLSRSSAGDGPLVAFGGSDGVIRVLSMITWKLVRRYTGGHKGSISCLMTFMASSGEALLVSGASDGSLVVWSADHAQDSRELVPKLSLKAHDGGVVAVELSRVMGGAPQLITIGADKTLAIWDTISFKELRRIKPVPRLACHSVASWCHPRAPNLDILTCVKDSHIWYVAVVWPDICYFSVYQVKDWSVVDSGTGRLLAWDTCRDRFALLETSLPPKIPIIPKGGSSRKAKEAAAAAAQAAAAAASAASTATVQVRILLDDGTSNVICRSIDGRNEPVIGLHGGALLGVAYRTSRRVTPMAATAISTLQSMPLSGFGSNGAYSSFSAVDSSVAEAALQNFQLYSWETFQPVSGLLSQPEWTAWDQTVEYCAFAYQQYIVISSLRPQYRYLGDVAIPSATGAVWHRRQLFVVTPTTIECVFVDAGVAPIDLETKRKKEEMKSKEAQARAVAEHGELALIAVEGPQVVTNERVSLRPPMLQVVRLASFQHPPSVPPFITLPKQSKVDGEDAVPAKESEERKVSEIAVGGGGVSVAVTRFPPEQKRPIGPLVVVGVRDGVLWLIDRYMCAHALALSHPGIRCRCLAAYGDAVSAVKWASRLGREHHDDLAQFMLGMGYATEALHLPGISKRLEFDLAMQSNDLKRALQCLLTMSNSRDIGHDNVGTDVTDILSLAAKKETLVDGVQGIVKFAKEFLDLIDAADATAQSDIAREALKRLAAAGSVKGALRGQELRGLALRLANHGELTRLSGLVNNLITAGQGREAAFSAAVLGDNALMEKAWQDTGMLAESVLHAHAHGRPTLKNLVQMWNQMLQKELEHSPSVKTDAAAAFLASLEEPKLTSLAEAGKKPPIEVLIPGMPSLTAAPISIQKKPMPAGQNTQQLPAKPLALEAPPTAAPPVSTPLPQQPGSDPLTTPVSSAPPPPASDTVAAPASDPATEPVSDSVSPTVNVPPSLEEAAS